ncbi:MAG: CysO-cysteine peptidase [Candidatus Heimdallarchaeota archaeon LC_3]|jgi:proteasome lid subunit RPN8/RPN11|nr:MAG: CysO-cysteine peptidase [Candidatus Heimdallarchaeota archaeon LC_3]
MEENGTSQQIYGNKIMKIEINEIEVNKIKSHGEKTFPEECCGVLIGSNNKYPVVEEVRPMRNINVGTKERRYNIDPMDLVKVDKEVEEVGLELLGIYHSHPNHPSRPSKFDLEHAWPNFSYMVLSVNEGKSDLITSWRLEPDRKKFLQEKIEILNENYTEN